jgi:hypothetical protein
MTTATHAPAAAPPTTGSLLAIYLRDHFAGASAGAALFRRSAKTSSTDRALLLSLCDEVEQDRASLLRIMTAHDVKPSPLLNLIALAAERAGRLKLNGTVVRRSPLSDVMELEAMIMAVRAKLAGWHALHVIAASNSHIDASELDQLITRADNQLRQLEGLHAQASVRAMSQHNTPGHDITSDDGPPSTIANSVSPTQQPRGFSSADESVSRHLVFPDGDDPTVQVSLHEAYDSVSPSNPVDSQ